MEEVFADLIFYIDIEEARREAPESVTTFTRGAIESLGGKVAEVYDAECTHLVLRHRTQDLYRAAQQLDQSVVSPDYIYQCFSEQRLVPESEEGVYPGREIPGFKERVQELTQTDFRGPDRLLVRYKSVCTGARYSGIMTVPGYTSHLVVKHLSTTSEKVVKAKRFPDIHIVSIDWLNACLEQWKFIDEEPYSLKHDQIVHSSGEDGGTGPVQSVVQPAGVEPAAQRKVNSEPEEQPMVESNVKANSGHGPKPTIPPSVELAVKSDLHPSHKEGDEPGASQAEEGVPKAELDPTMAIDDEMLNEAEEEAGQDISNKDGRANQPPEKASVQFAEQGKGLVASGDIVLATLDAEMIDDLGAEAEGMDNDNEPGFFLGSNMEGMDMSQQVAHAGAVIGALASQLDITTQVQQEAEQVASEPAGNWDANVNAVNETCNVPPTIPVDECEPGEAAQDKNGGEEQPAKPSDDDQCATSVHGVDPPMSVSKSMSPVEGKEAIQNAALDMEEAPIAEVIQGNNEPAKKEPITGVSSECVADAVEPILGPKDENNPKYALEVGEEEDGVQGVSVDDSDQDGNVDFEAQHTIPDVSEQAGDNVQDVDAVASGGSGVGGSRAMDMQNGNRSSDDQKMDGVESEAPVGDGSQPTAQSNENKEGRDSEVVDDSEPPPAVVRRSSRVTRTSRGQRASPGGSIQRCSRRQAAQALDNSDKEPVDEPQQRRPRGRPRGARQRVQPEDEQEAGEDTSDGQQELTVTRRPRRGQTSSKRTSLRQSEEPVEEVPITRGRRATRAVGRGSTNRKAAVKRGRPQKVDEGASSDAEEPKPKAPRRSLRARTPAKAVPKTSEAGGSQRVKRKSSMYPEADSTMTKRARKAQAKHHQETPSTQPAAKTSSQSIDRRRRRRRRHAQPEAVFAISGMDKAEKTEVTEMLAELEVKVVSGSFDPKTTHIVVPTLRRNDKTMCGMAAGKWIISSDYVHNSHEEGDLTEELPYELSKTDTDVIAEGAPAHWRARCRNVGAGAFDGIRAFFYGKLDGPGSDTLERIITAGGGKVVKKSLPYTELLKREAANVAVIGSDKCRVADRTIKAFLNAGVTCVTTDYIVDWVAHPEADLSEHRLFNSKGTPELKAIERARSSVTGVDASSDANTSASF